MRVVRQDDVGEEPDEILDGRLLRDEDIAVQPRVVSDDRVALEVGTGSDADAAADAVALADCHAVAALELVADLNACVDDRVASYDCARADDTGSSDVVAGSGVVVGCRCPEHRVRVDEASIAEHHIRVNHGEGRDSHPLAQRRPGIDHARGVNRCAVAGHWAHTHGHETRRRLCDYSPVPGRRRARDDQASTRR